jgi:hypothetical protein
MVYGVYLSRVTTPGNVRGGARIDESAQSSIVEPGGVVVVAIETQNIIVRENMTVSLNNSLISCSRSLPSRSHQGPYDFKTT